MSVVCTGAPTRALCSSLLQKRPELTDAFDVFELQYQYSVNKCAASRGSQGGRDQIAGFGYDLVPRYRIFSRSPHRVHLLGQARTIATLTSI